jgi:hypothetical protein
MALRNQLIRGFPYQPPYTETQILPIHHYSTNNLAETSDSTRVFVKSILQPANRYLDTPELLKNVYAYGIRPSSP